MKSRDVDPLACMTMKFVSPSLFVRILQFLRVEFFYELASAAFLQQHEVDDDVQLRMFYRTEMLYCAFLLNLGHRPRLDDIVMRTFRPLHHQGMTIKPHGH